MSSTALFTWPCCAGLGHHGAHDLLAITCDEGVWGIATVYFCCPASIFYLPAGCPACPLKLGSIPLFCCQGMGTSCMITGIVAGCWKCEWAKWTSGSGECAWAKHCKLPYRPALGTTFSWVKLQDMCFAGSRVWIQLWVDLLNSCYFCSGLSSTVEVLFFHLCVLIHVSSWLNTCLG